MLLITGRFKTLEEVNKYRVKRKCLAITYNGDIEALKKLLLMLDIKTDIYFWESFEDALKYRQENEDETTKIEIDLEFKENHEIVVFVYQVEPPQKFTRTGL